MGTKDQFFSKSEVQQTDKKTTDKVISIWSFALWGNNKLHLNNVT